MASELKHAPLVGRTPPARTSGAPEFPSPGLRLRQIATATIPPQPLPQRRAPRRVGAAVLGAGLAALAAVGIRLIKNPRQTAPPPGKQSQHIVPARYLNGAASVLALSVLGDSALEHYRGAFHNPAMYLAPAVAGASLANSIYMTVTPAHFGTARALLAAVTFATGLGGFGFHIYNIVKREGGVDLSNLFYGAPLGAPFALTLAGLAGLAGSRLAFDGERNRAARLFGVAAGPVLAGAGAFAMIGTMAEAALLHFRGAFHNPFMYVPMTLPPLSAAVLAAAAAYPGCARWARPILQATAAMGVAGVGFHAYGVHRNMGGFYNWSQNILNGPPLPAPPSFTGVALAGLGALKLMEQR